MRYCQTPYPGEEEIIEKILQSGNLLNNGSAVEFGAVDGEHLSNTKFLQEKYGFYRILFDYQPKSGNVIKARITAENVNELFRYWGVPATLTLLSIDVDGNDYWIWKSLEIKPAVVVIEYNGTIEPTKPVTIPYNPDFNWSAKDNYFGASWSAMKKLGEEKGYKYVCECGGLNAFFIREDLAVPEMPWNETVPAIVRSHKKIEGEWRDC